MHRLSSNATSRLAPRLAATGLLGLTVLLGACQSVAPPPGPTVALAKPTAQVVQPTPAPGAPTGALAQVRARGLLRVANTQASPPWNFMDDKNQVAGYDVDVANEVAKRLAIPKVEFVGSTFQDFIPGVQADKFDIVIAGQTITDERKQQVDFSAPYEVNGWSAFVSSSNEAIHTEADLAGKRIAATAGGTQETYAREKIANADVKTYENATLALTDVAVGRADAYLGSRFVGAYLADKAGLKVKALPGVLNKEVNGMSMKKGETELKTAIDRALSEMVADGTLTRISKQWLGGLDMADELKSLPNS